MTTLHDLDTLSTRQLLKLQGDIAARLATEVGKAQTAAKTAAQTAEARIRQELRADLTALATKWSERLAEAFPRTKATKPAPNGDKRAGAGAKGSKVPVKYQDDRGNAWSGRGKRPRWLTARIAGGATMDEFRVAP